MLECLRSWTLMITGLPPSPHVTTIHTSHDTTPHPMIPHHIAPCRIQPLRGHTMSCRTPPGQPMLDRNTSHGLSESLITSTNITPHHTASHNNTYNYITSITRHHATPHQVMVQTHHMTSQHVRSSNILRHCMKSIASITSRCITTRRNSRQHMISAWESLTTTRHSTEQHSTTEHDAQ